MQTYYSLLGSEPVVRAPGWRILWLGVSGALVMAGLCAAVFSSAAASGDSDAAWAWGGVIPVVFLGLAGLRRSAVLLVMAGAVFALVAASLGFVLLGMHHYDAWALVVLAVLAVVEVSALLAHLRRAASR